MVPSMKSVGEISSEIWSIVYFFYHFVENFSFDLSVKVIGTLVSEYALMVCTLVPSIKSVSEIASEI